MKNIFTLFILLFTSLLISAQGVIPNQVLVKTTPEANLDEIVKSINNQLGENAEIRVAKELSSRMNIFLLTHNSTISESDLVSKLYGQYGVIDAQLNHEIKLRETTPNDTQFATQWHHQNIQSELAWDITTGGTTALGDEIVVCVIEGGNLEHPDLAPNAWVNDLEIPNNGVDDDANGYVDDYLGWNVLSEDDAGVFSGNHGTQVMGMIGAKGDNDLGVSGINWDVKIMSVAGESLQDEASLVEAYDYPLEMRMLYEETSGAKGAFVVATNASWGIDYGQPSESPIWCGIYETMGEGGILNCGATSNSELDIDVVGDLPTACASDYMISVTATDINDIRDFSGYGQTTIDLGAPGDNVFTSTGTNGYGSSTGTSFASPLTAGVIGLLYSIPCASFAEYAHTNPQQAADSIRAALFNGVDPIANLLTETVTGGRVNAFNSLQLLLETCDGGSCYSPFSSSREMTDDTSYNLIWPDFNEENNYIVQYRFSTEDEWTESEVLTSGSFDLIDVPWCSMVEYQIKSICAEDQESDWSSTFSFTSNGCCVAPSIESTVVSDITDNSATISWESVLASTTYTIYYQLNEENFVVENITTNGYTLTGLSPCSKYSFSVSTSCEGGVAAELEDVSFFGTTGCGACLDLDYCLTEYAANNSNDEWIATVQMNELLNETGDDTSYALFSDLGWVLNRGNLYTTTITPGYQNNTFNEKVVIWLDMNQDGVFDDDELLTYQNLINENNPLEEELLIPLTTMLGETRMRVSMVGDSFNGSQEPCGEFTYGEVEDYCVTIEDFDSVYEQVDSPINVYPNPASSEIIINSTLQNSNYVILDLTGRVVFNGTINARNHKLSIETLTNGTYILSINDSSGNISQTQFVKM